MMFDSEVPFNDLPGLPPKENLETSGILKATITANKLLAELKGFCQTLPDPSLMLNTIVLQESKESSAIENIVTTQDELYKATLKLEFNDNQPAKEVLQYREALYMGLDQLKESNLITTNLLVRIMQKLRWSTENIRNLPGTKLHNPVTNTTVYTPPEGEALIREKMKLLEAFINDDSLSDLDPLIKMALIHYQFVAIHPFTDGNGRTGRILNILYLIQQDLLGLPILYLSKYIIENKSEYYRLLKGVTENKNWEEWVYYIVNGVAETSRDTLIRVKKILKLKEQAESELRQALGNKFSIELSNLLFSNPYIKISFLINKGLAKRQTASQYLREIEKAGWLQAVKYGREVYYVNHKLMDVLAH